MRRVLGLGPLAARRPSGAPVSRRPSVTTSRTRELVPPEELLIRPRAFPDAISRVFTNCDRSREILGFLTNVLRKRTRDVLVTLIPLPPGRQLSKLPAMTDTYSRALSRLEIGGCRLR